MLVGWYFFVVCRLWDGLRSKSCRENADSTGAAEWIHVVCPVIGDRRLLSLSASTHGVVDGSDHGPVLVDDEYAYRELRRWLAKQIGEARFLLTTSALTPLPSACF